jgi:hypothetical protein
MQPKTDRLSKIDSYVVVTYGSLRFKTRASGLGMHGGQHAARCMGGVT